MRFDMKIRPVKNVDAKTVLECMVVPQGTKLGSAQLKKAVSYIQTERLKLNQSDLCQVNNY